jgi:ubiquinone/menaquinone biosynthesis C-methylase UbiE
MIDNYFLEVFENVPRQGPGSNAETFKAYSFLTEIPKNPTILDIGCGKGIQTVELARISEAHIIAMDMHKPFLKALQHAVAEKELQAKISCLVGDMAQLPFLENEFNVIWAEGSVFIIGYKQALKEWKKQIKANGYLVFTDCVWLKSNPPKELADYWQAEEIELPTIPEVLEQAEKEGYKKINHFTLSKNSWSQEFYMPIEQKLEEAKDKYKENKEAQTTFSAIIKEIEIFNKYNDYFGYEFFVFQKGE